LPVSGLCRWLVAFQDVVVPRRELGLAHKLQELLLTGESAGQHSQHRLELVAAES